jgi:GAF domain-containing protein
MTDIPAMGGGVLLTDINSPDQVLWFESVTGPKSESIQNFRVPLGQGIIGYCAQQGVSQNIADVAHEPRYANDVLSSAGLAISSMICVPIQHQKRIYGAIVFYNPPGERPFTQGELSILSYLAHVAGEYLGQ